MLRRETKRRRMIGSAVLNVSVVINKVTFEQRLQGGEGSELWGIGMNCKCKDLEAGAIDQNQSPCG